jgi:hypothetical protein
VKIGVIGQSRESDARRLGSILWPSAIGLGHALTVVSAPVGVLGKPCSTGGAR